MSRFSIFEQSSQSNLSVSQSKCSSSRLVRRDNSFMFYKILRLMKDRNPKYFEKNNVLKNAMCLLGQPKNL